MKPAENIEKLIKKLHYKISPETHEDIYQNVLKEINKQKTGSKKPDIGRNIMKSPLFKIAAAAVILLGLVLLIVYATHNNNPQQNSDNQIVKTNDNDENIGIQNSEEKLAEDLLLAKQLFDDKDISGLANLLQSDFETVQLQAAQYLGLIGDETVLSELQKLADRWNGLAQDNEYENALSTIEERLSESESETEQPSQDTATNKEPDEPEETQDDSKTGVIGIVIDKKTAQPIQGAKAGFGNELSSVTDSDGKFMLYVPIPTSQIPDNVALDAPVYVTATNYTSQSIVVDLKKGQMIGVTIEMTTGSKLIGKVIDPNNEPIQDAEVSVLEYTTSAPVLTDSEGNFEIDGVNPAYPSPQIFVHHPLYPSVYMDFEPAPAGESVYKEIVLKPGVIVFGQVTNSKGEPVKGVTVGNTNSPLMWNVKKYVTKDDGTYVLDNIDTEEITLWTVHSNYAPFVGQRQIDLNQSQHQIDIKLDDPYELKGCVLDSMGNPVAGAFAIMFEYNGVYNIENTRYQCKPDGTFVIPNAPKSGKLTLEIYGESITRKTHEVDFSLDEQLITVDSSGRIYCQVLDAATGEIIPSFHVRMTATKTGDQAFGYSVSWSEEGHMFNSPEGYFDTGRQSLPIGKQYRITVSAEGYDPVTNDLVPVQPISDNPERTVFLLGPATLRIGRIINTNGQPIEGATITFYPFEDINYDQVMPDTTTDEKGIYSVLGLGSEYKIIEVNAPGYTPNFALLDDITKQDGHLKDITLDTGVRLSGYVFDDKGKGISGITVGAFIDPSRTNNVRTRLLDTRYAATTDENGFYDIPIAPSGRVLVIASDTDYYRRKKFEITPGQNTQLNFGDEDGYVISGTIRAGQQRLSKSVIYLFSSNGEMLSRAITDTQGKFILHYFEEDSYKLISSWNSKNSDDSENWPEDTNFRIDRDIIIEQNINFDMDMQENIVTNTNSGEIIEETDQ